MTLDLNLILTLAISLVTTFGGVVSLALRHYLLSKAKSEESRHLLGLVWDAMDGAVRRVYQESVPKLKAAAVDGKISEKEREDLKAFTLNYAKGALSGKRLDEVRKHFGLEKDEALDEWLITKLEHSVHNMRTERDAARRRDQ